MITGTARGRPRSSSATPPTARTAGSAIRSGNHTPWAPRHGRATLAARPCSLGRGGTVPDSCVDDVGAVRDGGSRTMLVLPVWPPQVQGPAT